MPTLEDFVAFNRQRAQVERQMGTNQLMCGSESGTMRIDRANMHDQTADLLATMRSDNINLAATIATLKAKLAKAKVTDDDV